MQKQLIKSLMKDIEAVNIKNNEEKIEQLLTIAEARLELAKLSGLSEKRVSELGVAMDILKRYGDFILRMVGYELKQQI